MQLLLLTIDILLSPQYTQNMQWRSKRRWRSKRWEKINRHRGKAATINFETTFEKTLIHSNI